MDLARRTETGICFGYAFSWKFHPERGAAVLEKKRQKNTTCDILSAADFLDGRDYRIDDCYSEHKSSYNDRLHFHDFYELSVIYEGTSRFLVNGSLFTMGKRSMQLIRPSDYHWQQTAAGEHIRYYNLTFSPDFLSEALRCELEKEQAPLCANADPAEWAELLPLLQKTCGIFKKEPDAVLGRIFIRSSIEMLCVFLLHRKDSLLKEQENEERPQVQIAQEAVRRAVTYIQKNYREPVRLADAAAAARLSPSYFSAMFHQAMGISFSRYLTEYRLQEAKRYLKTGELPVKQVAAVCGFSSYSYFVTAFKDCFGYTPGSLFKENRNIVKKEGAILY